MAVDERIPNVHPAHGGRANTVLVLGLLVLLCVPTGPAAWAIGRSELSAIRQGKAPIDGEGKARLGMILGIAQSVMLALGIVMMVLAALGLYRGVL